MKKIIIIILGLVILFSVGIYRGINAKKKGMSPQRVINEATFGIFGISNESELRQIGLYISLKNEYINQCVGKSSSDRCNYLYKSLKIDNLEKIYIRDCSKSAFEKREEDHKRLLKIIEKEPQKLDKLRKNLNDSYYTKECEEDKRMFPNSLK